jgi:uncharacterized membrane protein YoaT (DUF817 family)
LFNQFLIFLKKQASSAIFGGLLLFFIILTHYIEIPGFYRYDFLFIVALAIQVIFIVTKIEHPKEIIAIIVFHIMAMGMEIFKTSPEVGSWAYPEPALLAIATVPLFTGFMYSAVGSYIARSWRISKFTFVNLPRTSLLVLMGIAIYINFFTNHYTYDVRYILFVILVVLFWKTKFYFSLTNKQFGLHPLITNAFLAFVIWFAEQVSTFARVWVYPNQSEGWQPVSFHKFSSWYMLLILSFAIIAILYQRKAKKM